jgi:hypothetical protein
MTAPKTTRESAVELARRGVPVFPLLWRSKEPLPRSHGHLDASNDLTLTRRRWAGKLLNVGVGTGLQICTGFLSVLDVDGEDGYRSLAELERQHGVLPTTFKVKTSRGEHGYMTGPALPSRIGFMPGLDWKGTGGYVVGPCSVHPFGKVYTCVNWDAPIAAAPEWLLQIVQQKAMVDPTPSVAVRITDERAYGKAALRREVNALKLVTDYRNRELSRSAFKIGQLVHLEKVDKTTAFDALMGVAQDIGLDAKEAKSTILSGFKGAAEKVWSHRHAV